MVYIAIYVIHCYMVCMVLLAICYLLLYDIDCITWYMLFTAIWHTLLYGIHCYICYSLLYGMHGITCYMVYISSQRKRAFSNSNHRSHFACIFLFPFPVAGEKVGECPWEPSPSSPSGGRGARAPGLGRRARGAGHKRAGYHRARMWKKKELVVHCWSVRQKNLHLRWVK